MRKALVLLFLCSATALAQDNGRFRIVEGSRASGTPTVLLDTATGETWVLCGLPVDLRWCVVERGPDSGTRAQTAATLKYTKEMYREREEEERRDRVNAVPQVADTTWKPKSGRPVPRE